MTSVVPAGCGTAAGDLAGTLGLLAADANVEFSTWVAVADRRGPRNAVSLFVLDQLLEAGIAAEADDRLTALVNDIDDKLREDVNELEYAIRNATDVLHDRLLEDLEGIDFEGALTELAERALQEFANAVEERVDQAIDGWEARLRAQIEEVRQGIATLKARIEDDVAQVENRLEDLLANVWGLHTTQLEQDIAEIDAILASAIARLRQETQSLVARLKADVLTWVDDLQAWRPIEASPRRNPGIRLYARIDLALVGVNREGRRASATPGDGRLLIHCTPRRFRSARSRS